MVKNNTISEGFTLIEVLVAAAVLILLAAGFLGLQYIMSQNQVSAWNSYLSIEHANTAVSQITRELRDATQSGSGAYPLESASDQEIIFYTDVDFDMQVERVRYTLDGSNLIKGVIEPQGEPVIYPIDSEKERVVSEIVRNGSEPVFYYYNKNWPSDTTNNPLILADRISDTVQVKIILITNPKPLQDEFDYTLESDVKIRMLN